MIPENYKDFCKEVVKLARKYKVHSINATIHPEFDNPDGARDDIRFQWHQGRHGDIAPLHIETAHHFYEDM